METNLPAITTQLTEQQQSWLVLADQTANIKQTLQGKELALQGLCAKPANTYEEVDGILVTYDKEHKVLVAERLNFTNFIKDNLVEPLMAFEKRAKEYEPYVKLKAKHLQLRLEAEAKAAQEKAIETEKQSYLTALKNAAIQSETAYRMEMDRVVNVWFNKLLAHGSALPNDQTIEDNLKVIKFPTFQNSYARKHLTVEQCFELNKQVPEVNFQAIQTELIERAKQKFANEYHSAIYNREAAIAQNLKDQEQKAAAMKREAEEKSAMNTIIGTATAHTATIEAPKIKRTLVPIIEDTEQWTVNVMMQFIRLREHTFNYVRVKSYPYLTVTQMANALAKHHSETGEIIDGVQFKEEIK
jgi:hypothetical protein